jgi:hypothetical protein
MGQTDVASLLYADDGMHYPSPQWLAKLMDYIHTWMQGNFTKSKVMVFHPKEGESCSVPAQGPFEHLDTAALTR